MEGQVFQVFSAICPHLGCAVSYQGSADTYLCPCHKSAFTLAGALLPHADGSPNPAPRGLDALQWRVDDGALMVRWVRFKTGVTDQVEVG